MILSQTFVCSSIPFLSPSQRTYVKSAVMGSNFSNHCVELCVQNTVSDPTIDTPEGQFFRYWVHGGSLSTRFSTREDAIRDAKLHGHSDPIIEIVNQDGMSASQ